RFATSPPRLTILGGSLRDLAIASADPSRDGSRALGDRLRKRRTRILTGCRRLEKRDRSLSTPYRDLANLREGTKCEFRRFFAPEPPISMSQIGGLVRFLYRSREHRATDDCWQGSKWPERSVMHLSRARAPPPGHRIPPRKRRGNRCRRVRRAPKTPSTRQP